MRDNDSTIGNHPETVMEPSQSTNGAVHEPESEAGHIPDSHISPEEYCRRTIGPVELVQEDRAERFLAATDWERSVCGSGDRPYQVLQISVPDYINPDLLGLEVADYSGFRLVEAAPAERLVVMRVEGEDLYTDDLAMILAINESIKFNEPLSEVLQRISRRGHRRQSTWRVNGPEVLNDESDTKKQRVDDVVGIENAVTWFHDVDTLVAWGVEPAEIERARDIIASFSDKEQAVLRLIDLSRTKIANMLKVAEPSVGYRLGCMFDKAGVEKHIELLLLAFQAGAILLEPDQRHAAVSKLTKREREATRLSVLALNQMAARFDCSENTVGGFIRSAKRKMGADNRVELVAAAVRHRVLGINDFEPAPSAEE